MQSGAQFPAIVQSMEGLQSYRGDYATYCKRSAQRRHRHRVNADLKLLARGGMDEDDFNGSPEKEGCSAWDIW